MNLCRVPFQWDRSCVLRLVLSSPHGFCHALSSHVGLPTYTLRSVTSCRTYTRTLAETRGTQRFNDDDDVLPVSSSSLSSSSSLNHFVWLLRVCETEFFVPATRNVSVKLQRVGSAAEIPICYESIVSSRNAILVDIPSNKTVFLVKYHHPNVRTDISECIFHNLTR